MIPIATITDQTGDAVAWQGSWTQHFSKLAGANAPPEINLEEPVFGGDPTLREKQIIGVLGVDVGHAPLVAKNLDGGFQISGRLRGQRQCGQQCDGHQLQSRDRQ